MITVDEYIQLKAFARQDGFYIGLLWVFTFACFVGSLSSPELQVGFVGGLTIAPFIVYYRLRHFRDRILGGFISLRRAFAYTGHTVFYASIILAAAAYVYFSFIDGGALMSNLRHSVGMTEMQPVLKSMGMKLSDVEMQLDVMSQLRPVDIAISMFANCLIGGLMLALLLSVIGWKRERKQDTEEMKS